MTFTVKQWYGDLEGVSPPGQFWNFDVTAPGLPQWTEGGSYRTIETSVEEYIAELIATCDRYVRKNAAIVGNLEKSAYRFNLAYPIVSFRLSADLRRDFLPIYPGMRLWGVVEQLPYIFGATQNFPRYGGNATSEWVGVGGVAEINPLPLDNYSSLLGYWAGTRLPPLPAGTPHSNGYQSDSGDTRVSRILLAADGRVVTYSNPVGLQLQGIDYASWGYPGQHEYNVLPSDIAAIIWCSFRPGTIIYPDLK